VDATTIHEMRSDGSRDHQLIPQPRPVRRGHCGPQVFDITPAWSPDGRRIAWVRYGCAIGSKKRGVWIARADGSGGHRIAYGFGPSWSPDGKRLAITRPTSRGTSGVFVVNADGSGLTLVANEARGASWSPDGKTLVMGSSGPDVPTGLAYVAPDGTGRVETGVAGVSADWSPDGRHIVFVGDTEATGEIKVLDFVSGEIQPLTTNQVFDSDPTWSPDGSRIAWVEQRRIAGHVHHGIYVMTSDGSGVHRLRDGVDPDWRP
jgi:TolB protein